MPTKKTIDEIARLGQEKTDSETRLDDKTKGKLEKRKTEWDEDHAMLAVSPLYNFSEVLGYISLFSGFLLFGELVWIGQEMWKHSFDWIVKKDPMLLWVSGYTAAIFILIILSDWPMRRLMILTGRSNYEKEKDWIALLPFPADGYLEALGHKNWKMGYKKVFGHKGSGKQDVGYGVDFTLTYQHEKPKQQFIENIANGANLKLDSKRISDDDATDTDIFSVEDLKSRLLYKKMHRLVDEIFLPLHEKYPLAKLTIAISDSGQAFLKQE